MTEFADGATPMPSKIDSQSTRMAIVTKPARARRPADGNAARKA
jgi:hypothetical protein